MHMHMHMHMHIQRPCLDTHRFSYKSLYMNDSPGEDIACHLYSVVAVIDEVTTAHATHTATHLTHTASCKDIACYRVAKTHRMPGRAASGGALAPAPEPAARHRGRTTVPMDCCEPFLPYFFRNQTSPHS